MQSLDDNDVSQTILLFHSDTPHSYVETMDFTSRFIDSLGDDPQLRRFALFHFNNDGDYPAEEASIFFGIDKSQVYSLRRKLLVRYRRFESGLTQPYQVNGHRG